MLLSVAILSRLVCRVEKLVDFSICSRIAFVKWIIRNDDEVHFRQLTILNLSGALQQCFIEIRTVYMYCIASVCPAGHLCVNIM